MASLEQTIETDNLEEAAACSDDESELEHQESTPPAEFEIETDHKETATTDENIEEHLKCPESERLDTNDPPMEDWDEEEQDSTDDQPSKEPTVDPCKQYMGDEHVEIKQGMSQTFKVY